MAEKKLQVLSFEAYLDRLPRRGEIPPATQSQIRRLYTQDAAGIVDKELINEVASRVAARGEFVIDITDIYSEGWHVHKFPPEQVIERNVEGNPSVIRLGGSGKIVRLPNWWSNDKKDYENRIRFENWIDDVGLLWTDWGRFTLKTKLNELSDARMGGDPREIMIAVDGVINLIHGAGSMAYMFIENDPDDVEELLDVLAGKVPPKAPHRREVRVRRYRRRA